MPVSISERFRKMEDIAQRGVFMFLAEVFRFYESSHKNPRFKEAGEDYNVPIPPACREQILVDFEPYIDMQKASEARLRLMKKQ